MMAYTEDEKKRIIDTAMNNFRELHVFFNSYRGISYALNVDGKIKNGKLESLGNTLTLSISEE